MVAELVVVEGRAPERWDRAEIAQVLSSMSGVFDGQEPVDELAHALQCATLAVKAGAGADLVAAALLHDVARAPTVAAQYPGLPHERAGARWLADRGQPKAAWLVEAHVPAKVWLVRNDPAYRQGLSEESKLSLERQAGADVAAWSGHPWWPEAVQVRRWDDGAKIPGARTLSIEELLSTIGL